MSHAPAVGSRPKPAEFHVFDTTLRDGSQQEGLSLSVADKLAIAGLLDELGVDFIEGGWPGANPGDTAFFPAMADGALSCATPTWWRSASPGGWACARPTTRSPPRCATPGRPVRLHGGQEPRPARRAGAADHAGREPGHDHRHGQPPARRGPAGLRGLRALLRRLPGEPGVRPGGGPGGRRGRAPRSSCSATPTAGCCRPGSARSSPRPAQDRRASWASTATTTPAARWPTPWPPSTPARCTSRAPSTVTGSGPATPS